jgi:hypothetical protein
MNHQSCEVKGWSKMVEDRGLEMVIAQRSRNRNRTVKMNPYS